MDLRAYSFRCFLTLAEERSFTRAADLLGLTQSALSMRIRDMERQLGLRLFHRSSRSVELTSEGAELLDQARRVVAEAARFGTLVDTLRSTPETPLRIAAPVTAMGAGTWTSLLNWFRDLEPKVEIRIARHATSDIVTAVADGGADIGFVAGRPDTNLPLITLARHAVMLAVPDDWAVAGKSRLERADLAGLRIASFDRAINPGLYDQTLEPLRAVGAELVHAPEGIIGAGFATRARLATLIFQEDPTTAAPPDRMRLLALDGYDLAVELCALRSADTSRRSVRRFWELARVSAAKAQNHKQT
jgi:DNA-binding transcriptional LysR family regulator